MNQRNRHLHVVPEHSGQIAPEHNTPDRTSHKTWRQFGAILLVTASALWVDKYGHDVGDYASKAAEAFASSQSNVYEQVDETIPYKVKSGDTLGEIADRAALAIEGKQHHQELVANIRDFNHLERAGDLAAGDIIYLPADINDINLENQG